jgi:hypothetical protein
VLQQKVAPVNARLEKKCFEKKSFHTASRDLVAAQRALA